MSDVWFIMKGITMDTFRGEIFTVRNSSGFFFIPHGTNKKKKKRDVRRQCDVM
jgi:hypothetical protein